MALKISVGSGATLATNILNGEHLQVISPVSLYPLPAGSNFIGLASVLGTVGVSGTVSTSETALISLASGTEVRSLATILNFPATQAVSFNQLVSLPSGTLVQVGDNGSSLTVDNGGTFAVQAAQSGNWDIRSVLSLASINGTVAVSGTVPVSGTFWQSTQPVSFNQLVSLASGTEVKSLATINNWPSTQAVTQSGTWNVGVTGLISLASGTSVLTSFSGLISLASGTEVKALATINNWPATQAVTQSGSWNVGINSGANYIGLATVTMANSLSLGQVTLFPGPNQIGSVTVSNVVPVTDNGGSLTVDGTVAATQSGTWNTGVTGLISLASGTFVSLNTGSNYIGLATVTMANSLSLGMVTLFPGPNQIGSVTISNTPGVTQSGTWTVQPGNTANTTPWLVTQSNGLISLASGTFVSLNAGTNNIGDVDVLTLPALPTGANYIGLATVTMSNSINVGMTTLFPGPNQIGSVTVSNVVAVSQSGAWSESITGLISLASGTFISLNAGTNNIGDVDVLTLPAIPAGGNYIGLVTAYPGAAFPVTDNSGSLTVDGTVGVSGLISLASGTFVSLNAGTNNIGDVDILTIAAGDNNIGNVDVVTLPALPASSNFIGLVSAASINGTVGLAAGTNVIGTATTYSVPISTYTSFATLYSASGNATLFVPPNNQRWVLKDLLISSLGNQVVSVKSGTQELFPPIGLATLGGFVMNNGDSGLRAKAVNESFVLNLGATATLSVIANVRFDL